MDACVPACHSAPMDQIIAYLNAHPLLWLAVAAIIGLTVLRIIAKIACLAVCIAAGLIVAGTLLALFQGSA